VQLVYVAFDILYDDNQSLINLPLRVRQQRLAASVKCLPAEANAGVLLGPEGGCIRGRIVTLLPNLPVPLPVEGECGIECLWHWGKGDCRALRKPNVAARVAPHVFDRSVSKRF
jgi:transposase InsO family protein